MRKSRTGWRAGTAMRRKGEEAGAHSAVVGNGSGLGEGSRSPELVAAVTNGVGEEGVAGTGVVLALANERAEATRSSTGRLPGQSKRREEGGASGQGRARASTATATRRQGAAMGETGAKS
jgi:hypothetical protein